MILSVPKPARCATLAVLLVFGAFIDFGHMQAGCPPNAPDPGWQTGAVIRYRLDHLPNDTLKLAAQEAITQWNAANETNGSNVRFEIGGNELMFLEGGVQGPDGGEAVAGWKPTLRDANSGVLQAAQIIIDTGAEATDPNTGQLVHVLDPTRPNYWEALVGIFLHEIAHTLGLDNVPFDNQAAMNCGDVVRDGSVMNPFCGVNDRGWDGQGGAQPTYITGCDNDVIASRYPEPEYDFEELPSEEEQEDMECYDTYRVTYTFQILSSGEWRLTSVSYEYLWTECYPLEAEG